MEKGGPIKGGREDERHPGKRVAFLLSFIILGNVFVWNCFSFFFIKLFKKCI